MQRDPKRQREHDRERQEKRPAVEERGEHCGACQGGNAKPNQTVGLVAQIDDLGRVPLVAENQGREEGEGKEHRRRARTARGQQNRGRPGPGRKQNAEPGRDQEVIPLSSGHLFPHTGKKGPGGLICLPPLACIPP
jgi:hypothetical protein